MVEWARADGHPEDELADLKKQPPIFAKEWARDHGARISGLNIAEANSKPTPALVGPAHMPDESTHIGDQTAAARAVIEREVDVALQQMLRHLFPDRQADPGVREGGGMSPAAAGGKHGEQPVVSKPTVEPWMEPGLLGQVGAVMALQGGTEAERQLLDLPAKDRRPISGGVNETMRVDLGGEMYGYHKSFVGIDDQCARSYGQSTRQQPVHEVAAWRMAEALGKPWADIVPPCVLRTVDGVLGSLSLERSGEPRGLPVEEQSKAAAFFDALIGQQDRHGMNFLTDPVIDQLSLIDHGFAFAKPGGVVNLSVFVSDRVIHDPQLTVGERSALQKLLGSPDLFGMTRVLEADRAEALRVRAERMLTSNCILGAGDF